MDQIEKIKEVKRPRDLLSHLNKFPTLDTLVSKKEKRKKKKRVTFWSG